MKSVILLEIVMVMVQFTNAISHLAANRNAGGYLSPNAYSHTGWSNKLYGRYRSDSPLVLLPAHVAHSSPYLGDNELSSVTKLHNRLNKDTNPNAVYIDGDESNEVSDNGLDADRWGYGYGSGYGSGYNYNPGNYGYGSGNYGYGSGNYGYNSGTSFWSALLG